MAKSSRGYKGRGRSKSPTTKAAKSAAKNRGKHSGKTKSQRSHG